MDPGSTRSGSSTSSTKLRKSVSSLCSTDLPRNSNNRYELHNSVSELFHMLNVSENKHFNKELSAERLEQNLNRQSSKPFSLFYNRLSDNQKFVEQYQQLKCQNINEVDPFVRLLVRVREDKTLSHFINNYEDILNNKIKIQSTHKNLPHRQSVQNKSNSSSKSNRPHSATLAQIEMINNNNNNIIKTDLDLKPNKMNPLVKSRSMKSPLHVANRLNTNQPALSPMSTNSIKSIDSGRTVSNTSMCSVSSSASPNTVTHHHHQNNRKVPPYLSRDFHPGDWPKDNDCFGTLGNYSFQEQEQLLLRDLLFVLIGIEGRFIRLSQSDESSHYKLILDPTTDHFFSVTTNRILKICYHYSSIVTFVESRVYGLVNQALVATIQQHLYDYNMNICQMEESLMKNDLFLQKMFFILLPYFSTFSLLKEICTKLYKNKCVGGAVLTLLHEKTKSIQGMDNKALELCLNMTKSAAMPYFEIMKTWIYYGEIGDPRKEFFIEDFNDQNTNIGIQSTNMNGGPSADLNNHNGNDGIESDDEYDDDFGKFNDKYWDERYRINSAKTPCFLKNHEKMIYKTGKYVSIINKVKQLLMKSSKVIPIPQSLNLCAATTVQSSAGSLHTETVKSSVMGPASSVGGSFMFLNQNNPCYPLQQNQNQILLNHHNTTIADNSLASMASSSSSNTSHSGQGRGNTPTAAIFTPKPEEIYYSFDESTYLTPIVSAYEEASSQLLHILIHESQLVETFNAVKHYMLLSMGDFIVHFIKFASKDLCKRTDSVVQHRLDSMMGMALGISVCHSDRQYLKDDPHIEFVGKSFLKQIYQINMKPFNEFSMMNDPSPSSSYLLRCDDDADEDEDDETDVALNRSIISSVIEAAGIDEQSSKHDGKIRRTKYLNNSAPKNIPEDNVDQGNDNRTTSKQIKSNEETNGSKLFCYESLQLRLDVPFPLSLIFTQKSIVCYELLFRYIFLCRYAEMELEETWKDNILNIQLKRCDTVNLLNQLSNSNEQQQQLNLNQIDLQQEPKETTAHLLAKEFKSLHKKAFALRYKMIAFVRNFHYFYAFEVIDPFFAQFIGQITKRGSSLDSVIECHEKFLENCFSSCFLTSIEITTIIIKIFTLCIELSHVLKDSIDVEDQSSMMESSCFFGSNNLNNPFSAKNSNDQAEQDLHDKLNRIFFSNRIFSGIQNTGTTASNRTKCKRDRCTIKEIIEKANAEFDSLVSQLLKKIYSDNCEYHMMYPFVARLDYNDFYRIQILE